MDLQRYRELFISESREHLGAAYELLGRWEARPADAEAPGELLRHAHSLKGMAATMGYASMVRLAHAMEDLSEGLREQSVEPSGIPFHMLGTALTRLGRIVDSVEGGIEDAADDAADELARQLRGWITDPPSGKEHATDCRTCAHRNLAPPQTPTVGPLKRHEDYRPAPRRWCIDLTISRGSDDSAERTVRALERLRNAGRVVRVTPPLLSGNPPRFDGRLSLVLDYPGSRDALEARLHGIPELAQFELRPDSVEQDTPTPVDAPRRWTRVRADLLDSVLELVLDVILEQERARQAADRSSRPLQRHLEHSELLLKTLYARVRELRLVPFRVVTQRLKQSVYELAEELGKRVHFAIEGGDVELDRATLDELLDPLLHMVRNALDHGVESPEKRSAAGKPPSARLLLSLERDGDRVVISLEDDGHGIQVSALRDAAVARGLLTRQAADALSEGEALMLTTWPGFSTAPEVTELSGRGVGMDVVRRNVEDLGGRLRIESQPGRGTRVELELPLNLALIPAVLVRCAGESYALPVQQVQETLDLDAAGARVAADHEVSSATSGTIELRRLSERLGIEKPGVQAGSPGTVLVLTETPHPIGLVVDEVLGQRQILVKPLREPLAGLRPYSGAALLEDATIALVIDARLL
jgi:two-component system chemotaxis sensor kinase CheA